MLPPDEKAVCKPRFGGQHPTSIRAIQNSQDVRCCNSRLKTRRSAFHAYPALDPPGSPGVVVKTCTVARLVAPLALACLTALLTACGGGSHTAIPTGSIPAANTTLQAETGNNTSTANSFPGQKNGNAAPANVSKLPLTSLLYGGANTKIYATWLGWFGLPNHISVGYNSNTAAQVHAQVQDMMSRGMAGAISDWYGLQNTRKHLPINNFRYAGQVILTFLMVLRFLFSTILSPIT